MQHNSSAQELNVRELDERLRQGQSIVLLDVREDLEVEICRLDGSVHIPMGQLPERLNELNSTDEIVVYCHHGHRSRVVTSWLAQSGFTNVKNLTGGIHAWALQADRTMRKY